MSKTVGKLLSFSNCFMSFLIFKFMLSLPSI